MNLEKFTDRAKGFLQAAQTVAIRLNHQRIAPEHIPRLTERFYRLDRSRSRDTGGTGLGLAIVKHVLQRHGAQLQIRSTIGKGSEFSVVFPPSRVRKQLAEELV